MIDTIQKKVDLHKFVLPETGATATYKKVESVADRLHDHLNTPDALVRIQESNQPGNSRPNVVSLVIDNKSSFLAGLRPLICHTYATQIWSTSSVDF